jgi:hypothetical protein
MGVCEGDTWYDECGVCGGDGSSCYCVPDWEWCSSYYDCCSGYCESGMYCSPY